jgi:hypothetical protein
METAMDEYTFLVAARLKADRLKLERSGGSDSLQGPEEAVERSSYRRSVRTGSPDAAASWADSVSINKPAVVGAILVNAVFLAALEWGAYAAQEPPAGEVTVAQIVPAEEGTLLAGVAGAQGVRL